MISSVLKSSSSPEAAVASTLEELSRLPSGTNEAETRAKAIDKILSALGWAESDIARELPSGTGEFLDYVLSTEGQPWMVVEAKRKGEVFAISPEPPKAARTRHRTVESVRQRGNPVLDRVFKQAADYCHDKGVVLACVTNGHQWVFFRGQVAPGRKWLRGEAITFESAAAIVDRFDDFCRCLSKASANDAWLLRQLEPAVAAPEVAPLRPVDLLPRLGTKTSPPAAARLEAVRAFGLRFLGEIHKSEHRLSGDNLLDFCYVPTDISGQLDKTLTTMLEEDEEARLPTNDARTANATEFGDSLREWHDRQTAREPVLVIGNRGAGKTTYIARAVKTLRDQDQGAFLGVVDMTNIEDKATSAGLDLQAQMAATITQQLKKSAFAQLGAKKLREASRAALDPDSVAAFRSIWHQKIELERSNFEALHGTAAPGWDEAEAALFREYKGNPVLRVTSYIRHLAKYMHRPGGGRAHQPRPAVVVIDNVDLESAECQAAAYRLATRICQESKAIVVIALREDTYAKAVDADGFLSGRTLAFVYHVTAPPLDRVVASRRDFARHLVASSSSQLPDGLRTDPLVIEQCCRWLEDALPVGAESVGFVAGVCAGNVRAALDAIRQALIGSRSAVSPVGADVDHLMDCLFAVRSVREARDLVLGLSNGFEPELSDRVLHALPWRLLAYLEWARSTPNQRHAREAEEAVVAGFALWGYPDTAIRRAIRRLTAMDLIGRTVVRDQPRLRLTASGYVHLRRLLSSPTYRLAMAVLTDWYNPQICERFVDLALKAASPQSGLSFGDLAVAGAVALFDEYLAAQIAIENDGLVSSFDPDWKLAVLTHAPVVAPRPGGHPRSESSVGAPVPAKATRGGGRRAGWQTEAPGQMSLFPVDDKPRDVAATAARLAKIPLGIRIHGTVDLPRILWALEFAGLTGRGPQSPADLARLFSEFGGHLVQTNNVARAFRTWNPNSEAHSWWTCERKRYTITAAGTARLQSLLAEAQA